MVRKAHTLISSGGKSRAGEKSNTPKHRELEYVKKKEKTVEDNVAHEKDGLYECAI